MAMPGQTNAESEIMRHIQKGPEKGGQELTRQLM